MASLYLLAHYDDELFCLGNLFNEILNSSQDNQVVIFHIFGDDERREKFMKECLPQLNCFSNRIAHHHMNLEPLSSRMMKEEIHQIVIDRLHELDRKYYFDKVYVPASDNHPDHSYVNHLAKLYFRPDRNSTISKLVEFSVPGSDIGLDPKYVVNTYFTINQRIIQRVEKYFDIYKDYLKGKNAYEHYKKKLIYNGSKVDGEYAETYHNVFHII
jgi:LmbE family N-acetylglucosaminyl deacetylase